VSEDEVVVTLVSIVVGPAAWVIWLFRQSRARHIRQPDTLNILAGALLVSAVVIFGVLDTVASFDVVDDVRYQFMYFVLGLAWLRVAQSAFAFAGVSARDDVVERGNVAAAIALSGALIGTSLCYAGGNIGDGPGWWVVVFCAALATGTLMAAWIVVTSLTGMADAVVIERDRAAGWRLAGFLVGLGLVLGRGVAGDWRSGIETIVDFVTALPAAALLTGSAIAIERALRPTVERPHGHPFTVGVAPALVYLGMAVTGVRLLGWPS
jgi:uncharacterized membrane protein YjfL (UPF0719 family)